MYCAIDDTERVIIAKHENFIVCSELLYLWDCNDNNQTYVLPIDEPLTFNCLSQSTIDTLNGYDSTDRIQSLQDLIRVLNKRSTNVVNSVLLTMQCDNRAKDDLHYKYSVNSTKSKLIEDK